MRGFGDVLGILENRSAWIFFYLQKYQGLRWVGNLLVEALGKDRMLLEVADCGSKSIIPWNRAAPRVDGKEIKPSELWEKGWICVSNLSSLLPGEQNSLLQPRFLSGNPDFSWEEMPQKKI